MINFENLWNHFNCFLSKRLIGILHVFLMANTLVFGQIQQPRTPQIQKIEPINTQKSHNKCQQRVPNSGERTTIGNQAVLQTEKITPEFVYRKLSRNNTVLTPQSFIPPKQIESIDYIHGLIKGVKSTNFNELPPLTNNRSRFEDAYNQIASMLKGEIDLNLKEVVFLTENSFLDGALDKLAFDTYIKKAATFIKKKIVQDGHNPEDDLTVNFYIHQYISDTLTLVENGKPITSVPKTYDFVDAFGIEDPSNMFVSKLIREGNGQCKSLPLLFLILVEELSGNAYLSFSPSHSFIKCKGRNSELFNIELTNGMLTNDAWLVGSGQIKSEAVKSGIFLDTLNRKQVIANCLVDLAMYYNWRFGKPDYQMGHDDFVLQCVDLALSYHPSNINAILLKSDHYTARLNYLARKHGYTTEEEVINNPETNQVFIKRNILYALTDGLGYEYFGEADYLKWIGQSDQNQETHSIQLKKIKEQIPSEK